MPLTPEEELELQLIESQSAPEVLDSPVGLTEDEELELAAIDQAEKQDISKIESFTRGAVEGASLGFSDEAAGLLRAGVRKIRGDETDFNQAFEEERDIERERNQLAEEANPLTSLAGGFAGGSASTIATGGAGISLAGFRAAAVLGGLSGVGFSNAKGSELAKDAAIGVALGLGGEAVFKGVGKAIKGITSKTSSPTNAVLAEIGESRHAQNVSFETSVYRQAMKGGFENMDDFFSSKAAQKTAVAWGKDAHKIPKDMIRNRINDANSRLKGIIAAPENQNKFVKVDDLLESFTGDEGLKQFRSSGLQASAVKTIDEQILKPLQSGELLLNNKPANPSALNFDQAIEFKRLVNELTFQNADPLQDSAEQFAFRKAPAVSAKLKQFAGDIIDRTNESDGTGLLTNVNDELSKLIDAESLAPRNLKELRALTGTFGDDKKFLNGQEFLLSLDQIDPTLKREIANEIVPTLTLVDAVDAATQWNLGVSTLFQAKAGAAAVGPLGAIVALGKGGSVLATQAVGKAAKAAFKIPRTIGGILKNGDLVVQKVSDLSPALAIQLNDMIHDRDIEGIRGAMEAALSDPNLVNNFEQGIGFEGNITSPEEAEIVRNQIMASPLSLSQKIQSINELDQQKKIPDIPQAPIKPPPTPMVLQRKASERSLDLVRKVEKEEGE